ncbi:MAG TPA: hypothetical protein VE130_04995 [Nitrososphaeraceae archaeon]|jgi:hypothetical protein|nr:hypothetical protein [Nitrososphaeraceae archaeon]
MFRGIYVDPEKDIAGVYSSYSVRPNADIMPGYLLQAAMHLAGG